MACHASLTWPDRFFSLYQRKKTVCPRETSVIRAWQSPGPPKCFTVKDRDTLMEQSNILLKQSVSHLLSRLPVWHWRAYTEG